MSATEGMLKPIPILTGADIARFRVKYAKYFDSDCWPWLGKPNPDGYGRFQIHPHGGFHAHRVAWYIEYGEPGKILVLHKCKQNRLCVNPAHLYLGTQSDNMYDTVKDNTNPCGHGILNHNAIFNESDIFEILDRHNKNYESGSEIARSLGREPAVINRILRGDGYKNSYRRYKCLD